jgi:CubicO group peptidase (beta-lactamase class C family)
MSEGIIDGRRVLPRAAVAETHRALVALRDRRGAVRVTGYGLGWQIGMLDGDRIVLHGGAFSGFATLVSFKPGRRTGVVVMANNTELGVVFADLANRAFYDVLSTGRSISDKSLDALTTELARARTRTVAGRR